MSKYRQLIESKKYTFVDTSFDQLMKRRIYKVLLVCNTYDAFMLEEDGRIDERIFNEYFSLNLRYPPVFIQAHSVLQAFKILEDDAIDLIITMLTVEDINAFKLARRVKDIYPNKPIVVLTPFSREVSMWLEREDLSVIDYVFCWLGNADILLAIIKLIEDKMNLRSDVEQSGVQAILLVEDSIRYYSSYLPHIYKIIFQQSKRSVTEGLNEHQRMLLMRGRPKILLATNYTQAIELFDKYKDNLIGVISDMSFKVDGSKDAKAGVKLYNKVHKDDVHMPFLLQSSDSENENIAKKMGIGFINKYSKTLSIELRNYIIKYLAFGDFIFKNPATGEEIYRATDLKSLQEKVLKIPNETLEYHIKHNDFSKWLNARALFPIARMLKYITYSDFLNIDEVRTFIYDLIDTYRQYRGRGVIAKFDGKNIDEYLNFSRIGDGSVGGKARGLAYIDLILKKYELFDKWEGVKVTIPRTVVLSSDVFDEFMETHNLYSIALKSENDQEILNAFVEARLPSMVLQDLYTFIAAIKGPIAVRSSSKLEDSHYQPFAGIYSTYMVPKIENDTQLTLKFLTEAIKSVYASVFFKSSKAYMTATSNVIDEEKMGIILQEVCGQQYKNLYYPVISGVARSINFYPIAPEKSEDGIVSLAFGLGKYIVEGGQSLRFSPKYPKKILQLSSPEMALKNTQKYFYALDLTPESFKPSCDDGVNIANIPIKEVENGSSFKLVASTYDYQNQVLRDGIYEGGKKLVTFAHVLQHNVIPLSNILSELLEICQKEMGNPIEIEFAVDVDVPKDEPVIFNFLQIRPIVENKEMVNLNLNDIPLEKTIIYSKSALGNGIIQKIYDVVYVKPNTFNAAKNHKIAEVIEKINNEFVKNGKNYILIGPGRWGSSDPWLGIPVKWPQISSARLIVESGILINHLNQFVMNVEKIMNDLEKKHPGEVEYLQAVREVLESIEEVYNQNPQFESAKIIERLIEPDRILTFKIPWVDDKGEVQVNLGYRAQFNNAIGPYKGGLRFHPSVNISILKFLGFEQIFKNSLTTLPMGGSKGGSDFNPKGKSNAEVMRFCQGFMLELYKIIGPETDVPAGDIGVGGREIGFLYGMYRKLARENSGILTGKGLGWGGSLVRPEATGYGVVYFAQEMLKTKNTDFKGKIVAISGFGNVAWGAALKATELGAKVVTISGPDGYIYDKDGISRAKIDYMLELRASNNDIVKPYSYEFKAEFHEGKHPWEVKCDVALPCATQNELNEADANMLIKNGCICVTEGANMPSTPEAIEIFHKAKILFSPGKASNAGGVATSGLEMSQNAMKLNWSAEEVDKRLHEIMVSIHSQCMKHGKETDGFINYVKGANIAGFLKVANAMLDQGIY